MEAMSTIAAARPAAQAEHGAGRAHWVRFAHRGHERFGKLEGERIAIHRGDMFAGAQPTGETIPLEAVALLAPKAAMAVLVKPQFEAGPAHVRKGIVRDEGVRRAVCRETAAFVGALGFEIIDVIPSPIAGGDGNREFLLGARRG